MGKRATGWTHPDHWVVASVGTLCQIIAIAFVAIAIGVFPLFTDSRTKPDPIEYKLTDADIKCEVDYCYHSKVMPTNGPKIVSSREHVKDVKKKADPGWLKVARLLILVGAGSNALSLVLLLFIFWPVVCTGKVLNFMLHICRIIDFFGAPPKFIGCFFIIWYIADVNDSYLWWKYDGLLAVSPLPIGLVLFSYILQTLCFVCTTLATDKGACGKENHHERLQALASEGNGEKDEMFKRVSYHPIDQTRSSRVLAEVAQHFAKEESNV